MPHRLGYQWDKVRAMSNYQRGTLGQVGAKPGLARKVLGTPSSRQAAANKGLHPRQTTSVGRPITQAAGSANDLFGVLDDALSGTPWGKAMDSSVDRGPRVQDTEVRRWLRSEDPKRPAKGAKPAAPRTNAPQDA